MAGRFRSRQEILEVTGLAAVKRGNRYLILLVLLALGGQLMASYDFNLLVLTRGVCGMASGRRLRKHDPGDHR